MAEGCFGPKHRQQVLLPSGETVAVPFKVTAYHPGPFSLGAVIYVRDRSGLRTIEITAAGNAFASETAANPGLAASHP
jgi:hypothetical protein